jgi:arylsulfatase A
MRIHLLSAILSIALAAFTSLAAAAPPNIIFIYADDLAYADLGCTGAQGYSTPNIDRLAREGVRCTDFYVSSAVCSASRAALLTGCYHERVGMRGALGPQSKKGLGLEHPIIPELLKKAGYTTGMAGKWHLGSGPQWLPTARGFDSYLGIPYSADMWPFHPETPKAYPPLPLYDGTAELINGATAEDQKTFTLRYADRAVEFIKANQKNPFFFYFAPNQPHVPLFVSDANAGKSKRGLFGDVLQEIDQAVGQILQTLDDTGLAANTIVMFSSDNGPWLSYGNHAGSAGPLREGKGTSYEGGVRVPFLARWPGKFPAGHVSKVPLMTIDILPTLLAYAAVKPPDRTFDGRDISSILENKQDALPPHDALYFYYGPGELQAMRSGPWKLLFPHTSRTMIGAKPGADGTPGKYRPLPVGLELYDLTNDIGETKNLAQEKPEIIKELQAKADIIRQQLGDGLAKTKPAQ